MTPATRLLMLFLTLGFCAASFSFAEPPNRAQQSTPALTVRVDKDNWKGDSPADVEAVLRSTARELLPQFPGITLEPMRVSGIGGPITLFAREPDGSIRIKLDTGGRLWAQCAFQFAHELTHILCRYRPDKHPNKWFEESLCETGSLFALRKMGESWKTSPPYPNWKSYAPNLVEYAQKRITEHALPAGKSFVEWYTENKPALLKSAVDRPRNTTVATVLLPLFEKTPEHWAAVYYLNEGKRAADETFADCLQRWHDQTPKEHRAFVRALAAQFGISVIAN